jgi:Tfp pilus assembly protein PilP
MVRYSPVVLLGLSFLLASCKGAPPPVTAAPAGPAEAPVTQVLAHGVPAPSPATQPPPPLSFAYDPAGLRDPFEPFLKIEEKKPEFVPKAFVPTTPLQRFTVEELKLVGVLWTPGGQATALVEDPRSKGYMVAIGAYVGDRGGKIVRIQPDRVVIEERFTDLFGKEKVNVSNMVLHKSEGEVRP